MDYRMGNLASVAKALETNGADSLISDDAVALEDCDLLVLPGVGNFSAGMRNLSELGLTSLVKQWADAGKPMLGICLGMQLLFDISDEGDTAGLSVLPGSVVRLPRNVKVPHMGWNILKSDPASNVFGACDGRRFYFVHSYVCIPEDESVIAARTSYGLEFASAVERRNIVGVQFHPEKSSGLGLELLGRFLEAL